MIKHIKYLLGSFLVLFFSMCFSNAGYEQLIGIYNSSPSIYDSNYTITFLPGGTVTTELLGTTKSLLALENNVLFWWTPDGQPYFYSPNFQGFFGEYWTCDVVSGQVIASNCTSVPMDNDYRTIFKNFFSKVKAGGTAYYDYNYRYWIGGSAAEYNNRIQVCFESTELGKSLCFRYNWCRDTNSRYCDNLPNYGSLVNSQGLVDMSFGGVSDYWIGYAPGHVGYNGSGNIEGSSGIGETPSFTGDLMYSTCTNGYVISKLDKIYPNIKYTCYAGYVNNTDLVTSNFVGSGCFGVYEPSSDCQPVNYKDLFSATKEYYSYSNWFSNYYNEYLKYYTRQVGVNPFIGRPISLYSYFKGIVDFGFTPDFSFDIVNYCKLRLYSDWNAKYEGTYFSSQCNGLDNGYGGSVSTGEVGSVDNDNSEILPPGTIIYNPPSGGGSSGGGSSGGGSSGGGSSGGGGSSAGSNPSGNGNTSNGVIISVDWSGVISGANQNFDGKNFINDFYQKLKSNYQKPIRGGDGIIPNYIVVFLLAIILFRFLSH